MYSGEISLSSRKLFFNARAQHFRFGLQINHQVRRGNPGGKRFVVAVVELQLLIIQIQIGEDAILLQQKSDSTGAGAGRHSASRMRFCRSIRKYICVRSAEPGFSL